MAPSKRLATSAPKVIRNSAATNITTTTTATTGSPSTHAGTAAGKREEERATSSKASTPKLTHFVSIPLHAATASHSLLQASLNLFRREARALLSQADNASSADAQPSAVSTPEFYNQSIRGAGTLHLTLGVMSLVSAEQVSRAAQLLHDIDMRALLASSPSSSEASSAGAPGAPGDGDASTRVAASTAPIRIRLTGLESMHDAQSTTVLYISPDDASARLRPLCEAVRRAFVDAGLLKHDSRPLKLHATVMNTIYARTGATLTGRGRGRNRGRGNGRDRGAIDATGLLDRFKRFDWLSCSFSSSSSSVSSDKDCSTTTTAAAAITSSSSSSSTNTTTTMQGTTDINALPQMTLDRLSICEMGAKYNESSQELEYTEIASRALLP